MPLVIGSAIAWDPVLRLDALTTLSLGKALDDATLEENPGELARRLTLKVNNLPTARGPLSQLCALNQKLVLYGDWGQGRQEVFRGTIYDWDFDPLQSDELNLTLYDDLYQLMHSKDQRTLAAGTPYLNAIADTLREFGLQTGTLSGPAGSTQAAVNFKGEIGQYLINLLSDAAARGSFAYLLRMASASGAVDVILPGTNRPVYVFDQTVTDSARDTQSMDGLITEVRAAGQMLPSADPLRPALGDLYENPVASPKSNPPWPILRELLDSQQLGTSLDMQTQVDNLFRVKGAPKRTQRVRAVALPSLRKGDLIYLRTGTLEGYYGIVGVQINLKTDTMVLILNQSGTVDYPIQRLDPSAQGQTQSGPPSPPAPGTGYVPVVQNVSDPHSSVWTNQGSHHVDGHPEAGAMDIFAPRGSPIYAPISGTITFTSTNDPLGGNNAVMRGDDGRWYYFAHGNVPFASGKVTAGQQIGQVDNTGSAASTASHLHYAISTSNNFDALQGKGNVVFGPEVWTTSPLRAAETTPPIPAHGGV